MIAKDLHRISCGSFAEGKSSAIMGQPALARFMKYREMSRRGAPDIS
jgi:hypothetical protein